MGKSLLGLARRSGKQNMSMASTSASISKESSVPEKLSVDKESKHFEDEARKALEQATVPIQTRLESGARLWDQDFSSMSSYGSQDLEVYRIVQNSKQEVDYISEPENHKSRNASCDYSSSSGDSHQLLEEEEVIGKRRNYSKVRRQRSSESLSAELPQDVCGPAKNSIPLVMQSHDPYHDFQESIWQMVLENGIYEWEELQELLYCYIKLNSPELYHLITSAFVHVLLQLQTDSRFGSEECLDYDWP